MEGDADLDERGPVQGERYVVLDDLIAGEWYSFECADGDVIYAPFAGFQYTDLAKARGGVWFKVIMAGGRKKLIWSGHTVRISKR